MKNIYIISIVLFALSCTPVEDQVIRKGQVSTSRAKLNERANLNPKADSILLSLEKLEMTRDNLLNSVEENDKFNQLIVEEPEYNRLTNELFKTFETKKLTYGVLVQNVTEKQELLEQYKKSSDSLSLLIQEKCKVLEDAKKVCTEIFYQKIDFELLSIRKTKIDYSNYIVVKIKAVNNSGQRVEAMSFSLKLIDKLGREITTLQCKSSTRFSEYDILNYHYKEYDYDNSKIYKALDNSSFKAVGRTEGKLNGLNLDGVVIKPSQYCDDSLKVFTMKNKLCTLIEITDPQVSEYYDLSEKITKIDLQYPIIDEIENFSKKLIDKDAFRKMMKDALKGN